MKGIQAEVTCSAESAGLAKLPRHALPFPAFGHQPRYVDELRTLLPNLPTVAGSAATGK